MKGKGPLIFVVVMFLTCSRVAFAVPALQLWSPQGTYNEATESWVVLANPFELWLVGARTPEHVHIIDHLTLLIAIPNAYWDESHNPTLTIQTITSSDPVALGNPDKNPLVDWTLTLYEADLEYGNPGAISHFGGSNVPWHGIYPAHFWAIELSAEPDLKYKYETPDWPVVLDVDDRGEDAYDFTQDFDPADPEASGVDHYGDIQYYQISYSPYMANFLLHIDLVGFLHNTDWEKWGFAPFSHDCDATAPEPATVLLLGAGLIGFAFQGFRRKRAHSH